MQVSRVLIVEDDAAIGAELRTALNSAGLAASLVDSGVGALDAVQQFLPELVLLDLGLPDMDGVLLCRRLREEAPQAVIVVLTARTAELEVIVALDAGADDYLMKPFRLAELLARVRAHLRRAPAMGGPAADVVVGRLRVDLSGRRALVDGAEVMLRPKEFDLLAVLVAATGQMVSREHLMAEVWDEHWFGSTKTLDVHVSALRRKLAEHGQGWDRITTLRGRGYRFEPER